MTQSTECKLTHIEFAKQQKKLVECMEFLYDVAEAITNKHIVSRGSRWDYGNQIARMHEEVSEAYRSLRKHEPEDDYLCEVMDCIFSSITLPIITKSTKQDLTRAAQLTLIKLYKRQDMLPQ